MAQALLPSGCSPGALGAHISAHTGFRTTVLGLEPPAGLGRKPVLSMPMIHSTVKVQSGNTRWDLQLPSPNRLLPVLGVLWVEWISCVHWCSVLQADSGSAWGMCWSDAKSRAVAE